ncbi:hypothetical protein [Altericista sp. CCNU0014]
MADNDYEGPLNRLTSERSQFQGWGWAIFALISVWILSGYCDRF